MSGGSYEHTSAYVNVGTAYSSITGYGWNVYNASATYTKDIYTNSNEPSANYTSAKSIYGDAIYETSGSVDSYAAWYYGQSVMPRYNNPFFERGGVNEDASYASVYAFRYSDGASAYNCSFRPVLVVK